MIITYIEKQKKNNNRYNVYVDNKFSFSIAEEEIFKLDIYIDKEITEENIQYIHEFVNLANAKNKALRYVSFKRRSSYEVKNKLVDLGFDEDTISKIIDYLKEAKYINDYEYTKKHIKYLSEIRKLGIERIKLELKNKGISKNNIYKCLEECDTFECEKARKIINKKLSNLKMIDKKEIKKIENYLFRKGYTKEIIDIAFENLSDIYKL